MPNTGLELQFIEKIYVREIYKYTVEQNNFKGCKGYVLSNV